MSYDLYRITRAPYWWNGRRRTEYVIGDVVEVENYSDPDSDNDVCVRKPGDRTGRDEHYFPHMLNRSVLEPVEPEPKPVERVSVVALRSALALAGADGEAIDAVVTAATTIDTILLEAL